MKIKVVVLIIMGFNLLVASASSERAMEEGVVIMLRRMIDFHHNKEQRYPKSWDDFYGWVSSFDPEFKRAIELSAGFRVEDRYVLLDLSELTVDNKTTPLMFSSKKIVNPVNMQSGRWMVSVSNEGEGGLAYGWYPEAEFQEIWKRSGLEWPDAQDRNNDAARVSDSSNERKELVSEANDNVTAGNNDTDIERSDEEGAHFATGPKKGEETDQWWLWALGVILMFAIAGGVFALRQKRNPLRR